MKPELNQKYLITTNEWFSAPDGQMYKAVFGTVTAIRTDEETLGIKTNARSANWYVLIGNMIVAGCQIHYAIRSNDCSRRRYEGYHTNDDGIVEWTAASQIYFADENNES